MRRWRRPLRWGIGIILATAGGLAAAATVLYRPDPLFLHRAAYGGFRIFSAAPIPAGFDAAIQDVEVRIAAMERPDLRQDYRVFLCGATGFRLFAVATRKDPDSLAIVLTVPRNIILSLDGLHRMAAANDAGLRHTRFEGSPAEAIAHEVAHFHSLAILGRPRHSQLPIWKSEGWAEYQANAAYTGPEGPDALRERIRRLDDDALWAGRPPRARRLYEWHLLTEFLGEIDGMDLRRIADPAVTEGGTRAAMRRWARGDPASTS